MEPTSTLPVGYLLAEEYEIVGVIGSGGFGNTYIAHDKHLGRDIAIKEYFPRDIARREAGQDVRVAHARFDRSFAWGLERFIQEAKLLAKFRHPNIVRVFRTLDANNTGYIALDYVRGQELEGWLKSLARRPTQDELDELLAPLVDALGVVHQVGVLHRDIKPANIVIRDETGSPILLDFGASKYSLGEMTGTTMAIVSRGFSPYEAYAADSGSQGPWTDIYGLGATIYRALTDTVPPEATERLLDDTMTPLRAAGLTGYRADFIDAVDWALNVQPKTRPQSVGDWRAKLFRGANTTLLTWQRTAPHPGPLDQPTVIDTAPRPTTEVPKQPAKGKGALSFAVLVLLAITGGGGALYWMNGLPTHGPPGGISAASTPSSPSREVTPTNAAVEPAVIAPPSAGGSAQSVPKSGTDPAAEQKTALLAPVPAREPEAPKPAYSAKGIALAGAIVTAALVSNDGQTIVIGDEKGSLHQLDVASGTEKLLGKLKGPITALTDLGTSAGRIAAADGEGAVALVDIRSKTFQTLGKAASAGAFTKALAYSSNTAEIVAIDTRAGASRLARWKTDAHSSGPDFASELDGGVVRAVSVTGNDDLTVFVSADERVRAIHHTSGLTDDIFNWIPPATNWTSTVVLSPDSRLLARGGQYDSIEIFDARTRSSRPGIDLGDQAFARSLAFSGDGRRLAIDYTTHVNGVAVHRLRIVDPETGRKITELDHPGNAAGWVTFLPSNTGEYWLAASSEGVINICAADERCRLGSATE